MTQVFGEDGRVEAVTVIEAGPCLVSQIKRVKREGYDAVQLGFGQAKRLNSAQKGHLKKVGMLKYLREFKAADVDSIEVGNRVGADMFKAGDLVDISGTSKGRGFAGGVKRYHFAGGPKTHGQSDRYRAPGSIGAGTSPGRVWKGLRMAGHMGNRKVTVRKLKVIEADPERNLLLVRGAVPGSRKGLLTIMKSGS